MFLGVFGFQDGGRLMMTGENEKQEESGGPPTEPQQAPEIEDAYEAEKVADGVPDEDPPELLNGLSRHVAAPLGRTKVAHEQPGRTTNNYEMQIVRAAKIDRKRLA